MCELGDASLGWVADVRFLLAVCLVSDGGSVVSGVSSCALCHV